jgi:hypothetical protein
MGWFRAMCDRHYLVQELASREMAMLPGEFFRDRQERQAKVNCSLCTAPSLAN